MSCHSLLAWTMSIERSAVILMGIPLGVIFCFSLAAFKKMTIVKICLGISPEQLRQCGSESSLFQLVLLGRCTKAHILLGLHFVPFAGPGSSGDPMLGKHTLPRWVVRLIASPVPAAQLPKGTTGVPTQVCRASPLGSWPLTATLPADVSRPGSQEDLVSNGCLLTVCWGMLSLGPDCPSPSYSCCHPSAPLPPAGRGAGLQLANSPVVFAQSFLL